MEIFYTFPNTSTVIAAEQALIDAKISVKVRPIPNAIRAGCGLTLCISPEMRDKAEETFANAKVLYTEVYSLQDGQFTLLQKYGL